MSEHRRKQQRKSLFSKSPYQGRSARVVLSDSDLETSSSEFETVDVTQRLDRAIRYAQAYARDRATQNKAGDHVQQEKPVLIRGSPLPVPSTREDETQLTERKSDFARCNACGDQTETSMAIVKREDEESQLASLQQQLNELQRVHEAAITAHFQHCEQLKADCQNRCNKLEMHLEFLERRLAAVESTAHPLQHSLSQNPQPGGCDSENLPASGLEGKATSMTTIDQEQRFSPPSESQRGEQDPDKNVEQFGTCPLTDKEAWGGFPALQDVISFNQFWHLWEARPCFAPQQWEKLAHEDNTRAWIACAQYIQTKSQERGVYAHAFAETMEICRQSVGHSVEAVISNCIMPFDVAVHY